MLKMMPNIRPDPMLGEICSAVNVVQSKKCGGNGKLTARIEVFPGVKVSGQKWKLGGQTTGPKGKDDISAESKNKYEGLVVLCEPWEWPKKSAISSASKAPTIMPLYKTLA